MTITSGPPRLASAVGGAHAYGSAAGAGGARVDAGDASMYASAAAAAGGNASDGTGGPGEWLVGNAGGGTATPGE